MILDRLLEAKTTLAKVSPLKTLNRQLGLLAEFKTIIASAAKETKSREVKVYLSRIHNKADSLIGGLTTLDYTTKDMLAFKQAAFSRVTKLIDREQEKPSDRVNVKSSSLDDTLTDEDPTSYLSDPEKPSPEEQRKQERLLQGDEINNETIKKYANEGRSLNDLIAKKFIFARKPIIPILNPPIHPDSLAKAGFQVDRIGFYPILRKQLILGINTRYAIVVKTETKKTVQQLAEYLAKLLSKKVGVSYHIMGPSYKHKTGYYFWLLSEREVNILKKNVVIKKPDGSVVHPLKLVIKKWGFAF